MSSPDPTFLQQVAAAASSASSLGTSSDTENPTVTSTPPLSSTTTSSMDVDDELGSPPALEPAPVATQLGDSDEDQRPTKRQKVDVVSVDEGDEEEEDEEDEEGDTMPSLLAPPPLVPASSSTSSSNNNNNSSKATEAEAAAKAASSVAETETEPSPSTTTTASTLKTDQPDEEVRVLRVDSLAWKATRADLEELCGDFAMAPPPLVSSASDGDLATYRAKPEPYAVPLPAVCGTNLAPGSAFVCFESRAEARAAKATLRDREVAGRRVSMTVMTQGEWFSVMPTLIMFDKPTMEVGDLTYMIPEPTDGSFVVLVRPLAISTQLADVRLFLRACGDIPDEDIFFPYSPQGERLQEVFVRLHSQEQLDAAMACHGSVIGTKHVSVYRSDANRFEREAAMAQDFATSFCVIVESLARTVDEATLREFAAPAQCAKVVPVRSLLDNELTGEPVCSGGCAFLQLASEADLQLVLTKNGSAFRDMRCVDVTRCSQHEVNVQLQRHERAPSERGFVFLRGLPHKTQRHELVRFFRNADLDVSFVQPLGRFGGVAVELPKEADADAALALSGKPIRTRQVHITKASFAEVKPQAEKAMAEGEREPASRRGRRGGRRKRRRRSHDPTVPLSPSRRDRGDRRVMDRRRRDDFRRRPDDYRDRRDEPDYRRHDDYRHHDDYRRRDDRHDRPRRRDERHRHRDSDRRYDDDRRHSRQHHHHQYPAQPVPQQYPQQYAMPQPAAVVPVQYVAAPAPAPVVHVPQPQFVAAPQYVQPQQSYAQAQQLMRAAQQYAPQQQPQYQQQQYPQQQQPQPQQHYPQQYAQPAQPQYYAQPQQQQPPYQQPRYS